VSAALLVRVFLWGWFAAAVGAGHSLALRHVPPAVLGAAGVAIAAFLWMLSRRVRPLRRWCDGLYFLLSDEGALLPRGLALLAGAGDLVVAVMALPVALAPMADAARTRAIRIWSVVSLISLLGAAGMLFRLGLSEPVWLTPFAVLPFSLYPTFLLPLTLAAQALLLERMLRTDGD